MTWEIVTGIIALTGFIITIITFSNKVNSALIQNTCAITELRRTIEVLTKGYESHEKKIDNCEKDILLLKDHISS